MEYQKIEGASISNYVTIGMTVGVASKENRDGLKSRFLLLTLANKKSPLAKKGKPTLFEPDDISPNLIGALKQFCQAEPDAKGGYPVDMAAIKALQMKPNKSDEEKATIEIIEPYLTWPGGKVIPVKLDGKRYANDKDGKQVYEADNTTPVIKDEISVFVQIDTVTILPDGTERIDYFEPFSPNAQKDRIQRQFFKKPFIEPKVSATEVNTTPIEEAKAEAAEPTVF